MAGYIVKCKNTRSILILRVEYIYTVGLFGQFITIIYVFHHDFTFTLHEIPYLRMFPGVVVLAQNVFSEGPMDKNMGDCCTD